MAVLHVAGIAHAPGQDAERDGESVGEDGAVGESTRGNLSIQRLPRIDEHLVFAFAGIHRLGSGGVLI